MDKLKLGILGSGNGSDLPAIVDSIKNGELKGLAEIAVVISDKKDSGILEKAVEHKLYSVHINPKDYTYGETLSKKLFEGAINNYLNSFNLGLVVLIGYGRILSKEFVGKWKNKIMNVHPSLLPEYADLSDLGVHKAVLEDKCDISGCTIHFVDEGVDTGPIIIQASVLVEKDDTPEKLKQRVQKAEQFIYPIAIKHYAKGDLVFEEIKKNTIKIKGGKNFYFFNRRYK